MNLTRRQLGIVQVALEGQYTILMKEVSSGRAARNGRVTLVVQEATDTLTLHKEIQSYLCNRTSVEAAE